MKKELNFITYKGGYSSDMSIAGTKKRDEEYQKNFKYSKEDKQDIVRGILIFPFWLIGKFFYYIYAIWFKIPREQAILLGFFRFSCMFGLMVSSQGGYIYSFGIEKIAPIMPEFLFEFVAWVLAVIVIINFFISFVVMAGMYEGLSIRSVDYGTTGFSNIDEALNYRDGVLTQQTTSGKTKELAKTAFMSRGDFKSKCDESPEYKEAMEYLDGQLGMQSTSGKYNMLKNMISGKD